MKANVPIGLPIYEFMDTLSTLSFPLDSSTNGQPYQRLPYLEVEDNGLTRFIPFGACFPNY